MFGIGPQNNPHKKEVMKQPTIAKTKLPTKLVTSIDCEQEAIRAVRFNFDGNYCLTCGGDKTIKLWNPFKGLLIKKYTGHGYDVMDVVGSIDNCQLASCSSDKSVIYWDVQSGQIIRRFRGHAARVNCVGFNEESSVILSGSVDSSIKCWDCRSKKGYPIQTMEEAKDSITSIQVNGHEVLAGSIDGKVRRYDLRAGCIYSDNIDFPITCARFTKDGQCILVSSHDDILRLLDGSTGELLGEYKGHKNSNYTVQCALNKEDDHVISGSEDGCIYIWDLIEATVKEKIFVNLNKRPVHTLAVHPEKEILFCASGSKIHVYGPEDFEIPD